MAAGAKGIMDAVLGGTKSSVSVSATRPDHATARIGLVTEMSEGNLKSRLQRLVDPAICRIWSGNARRYELLKQADCQDLIDGLLAQGKQEFPAIVRTVQGGEGVEYEVICGARRHWATNWLRNSSYPAFKFLIEVRDMSDEEAFRLSDIENRDRADVSDFERSQIYLKALGDHYGGRQDQMAKRLEVSTSWLSRYLSLARLPNEILVCFADVRQIGIKTAAVLAPLLNHPHSTKLILAEAKALHQHPKEGLQAHEILKRLVAAAKPVKRKPGPLIITTDAGVKVFEIQKGSARTVDVRLFLGGGEDLETILSLLGEKLRSL